MARKPKYINVDAMREIKKTRSRFFSLFLLSALAVAFLAGLRSTAPDMEYTADQYYDRTHLMDVRVLSTLGLTDEDIEALRQVDGVEKAEGAWYVDAAIHASTNDLIVRFHSLSEEGINIPELLEGRMPMAVNECVVEPALLSDTGLAIGDELVPDMGGTDYEGTLRSVRYTIVGTVNSSLYMSRDRGTSTIGTGRLSAVAFLPREAFDLDCYTEAYLLAEGTEEMLCYDEEYEDRIDALLDDLEPLKEERAGLRYGEVIGEANEKLADAQQEYDDGEAEANEELADAWQKLTDARKELDDGWRDYYDGKEELEDQVAAAERKLRAGEETLAQAKAAYDSGLAEYEAGLAKIEAGEVQYEEGRKELEAREKEYEESYSALETGQAKYNGGLAEYEAGLAAYEAGLEELIAAEKDLKVAQTQLTDSAALLNQGQKEYEAGLRQYNEGMAGYQALVGTYRELESSFSEAALPAFVGEAISTPDTAYDKVEKLRSALTLILAQTESGTFQWQMLQNIIVHLPSSPSDLQGKAISSPTQLCYFLGAGYVALGQACTQTALTLQQSKSQLDAAKAKLDAGWKQYNAGAAEYSQGEAALASGQKKLAESKSQLDAAKRTLDASKKELDQGWAALKDGRQQLDEGWAALKASRQELDEGRESLEAAKQQLDEGLAAYNAGIAGIREGRQELEKEKAEGEKTLADALQKLTDGEKEYTDGVMEYEKGRAEAEEELSDARRKLNDARRDIADIENCKWYLLGRNTNMGYVSYQMDAERMGNLAQVFPLIFFLVAALVCLTTMTRMVEEQRVQIGSMKALGYSRGAIAK